jgi:hypothetical protein
MELGHPHSDTHAFELDASDWERYFERITGSDESLLVQVTVGSGRHRRIDGVAAWLLHAIRYDPRADQIQIEARAVPVPGVRLHLFVSAPRSIAVQHGEHAEVITVGDASGLQTLIRLAKRSGASCASLAAVAGRHPRKL